MRLLCLMAESEKKGFLLLVNDQIPNCAELARMVGSGTTPAQIKSLADELERAGVFSRDGKGVVYCRRMVRDAKKRKACVKGGKSAGKLNVEKQRGIFSSIKPTPMVASTPLYQSPKPAPVPNPKKVRPSVSCAAPASQAPAAPSKPGPFFIELPTNRFKAVGETWGVSLDEVVEFKALYPAVDVEQELRTMKGWGIANEAKRKTHKGMMRFVNSWLADKQNKGGGRTGGASAPLSQRPSFPERSGEIINLFPPKEEKLEA